MARFDVHAGRGRTGLVLDCQAKVLSDIDTRFVVPLQPPEQVPPPIRRLNPIFIIGGARYVMMTQLAAGVPTRELGPVVTSLIAEDTVIINALDMLLFGF